MTLCLHGTKLAACSMFILSCQSLAMRYGQYGKQDAKKCMQEVIKAACSKDDAGTGLPPKLRQVIVLMVSAAPRDSGLVKDVLVAIQHVLDLACSVSGLPELLLSLLQLPDVCQVSLHCQITASFSTLHFSPSLHIFANTPWPTYTTL